jgi:hypothetical protein
VDRELRRLAASGQRFETAISAESWISSYDPGHRISLESEGRTSFVQLDSIRECWQTLETQGAIRRADVLDPGRCSAFMMALFERVEGVRREHRDEPYLVLAQR